VRNTIAFACFHSFYYLLVTVFRSFLNPSLFAPHLRSLLYSTLLSMCLFFHLFFFDSLQSCTSFHLRALHVYALIDLYRADSSDGIAFWALSISMQFLPAPSFARYSSPFMRYLPAVVEYFWHAFTLENAWLHRLTSRPERWCLWFFFFLFFSSSRKQRASRKGIFGLFFLLCPSLLYSGFPLVLTNGSTQPSEI